METKDDSLKAAARVDSLNQEFRDSFRPDSQARLWLISSINRNIQAYRLVGVDAWDILTEAYIRAVKFVANGGMIWNLVSWLKSASVLIIHEHRRKFSRSNTTSIAEMDWISTWEFSPSAEVPDGEILTHNLRSALETLSQEDRDLLLWRVNEQLSWKKIRQLLIMRGESPPSYAALRQRKQRAVSKLRRSFLIEARANGLSQRELAVLFRELSLSTAAIK